MKLIESKAEYIPQEEGLEGMYKMIELAGRTAYHSQDKITPDSAKDFVNRMIKSKHGAALEHGTVYFKIPLKDFDYDSLWGADIDDTFPFYSPWVEHEIISDVDYVTTNYRFFLETHFESINAGSKELFLEKYLCSSTKFHEKRYTMRFTCSRAIAQELTRHRVFSFLMESQRYINYSKERHGGEITFIIPSWFNTIRGEGVYKETQWGTPEYNVNNIILGDKVINTSQSQSAIIERQWCNTLKSLENTYMFSIEECKLTPQQARDVLPNATKTELIMTGFSSDWRFLMDLRLFEKTGKVHPDMKKLMQKAKTAMQEADIWEDIMSEPSKFE